MNKIKVLGEEVTNKIAAGEIIERPVSIVKELVENSIDAEAQKIVIILENGGKRKIQIIDDGCGMDEEDALLCLERHATSKIRKVEDIISISSMGFRGEAIPSIASVSRMEITTKTEPSATATKIVIDFGRISSVTQVPANTGTEITISRLFDNLPVRKQFLKSDQVELKHIIEYIHYQALSFPKISFRLIHNNNERINYPAVRENINRYTAVLGSDFLKHNFVRIEESAARIALHGFISGLEEDSEPVGDFRYLFINGRYIRDRIIMHSINAGYEPFIKKTRFFNQGKTPPYVLFLQIDPELVDFNVHPAKQEVRFRDSHLAHSFVKTTIINALQEYQERRFNLQPAQDNTTAAEQEKPSGDVSFRQSPSNTKPEEKGKPPLKQNQGVKQKSINLRELYQTDLFKQEYKPTPADTMFDRKAIPSDIYIPAEEELVNPWQIHDSYVLVQCEDGLVIIDQHAAHERIIYEKLLHRMSGVPAVSQQLLFPVVIDIPPILADTITLLLEENSELLTKVGFAISSFSGNSLVVNEIPAELSDREGGEVFKDILFQLQDEFKQTKDFRDSIAKAVSCKAAIKINNRLGRKEMLTLINDLFACQVPWFCPHGRPIIIKLTLQELEKKFKRI